MDQNLLILCLIKIIYLTILKIVIPISAIISLLVLSSSDILSDIIFNKPNIGIGLFYVIISNFEQEACFILMFWAFAIMFLKGRTAMNERRLLRQDLIPLQLGNVITPRDTEDFLKRLDTMPETDKYLLLPRILSNGLKRISTSGIVQDVSISTHTMVDTEADRLESELSMIRYIAWAIPSIGFIGTVRGIGSALSLAHRAVDGDISGVTQNLGVAFNSTFIALLISIVIMFLVHQLQLLI